MEKLLWLILVAVFFAGCDCKRKLNDKNISEDISEDDEKCSEGMSSLLDSSTGYIQRFMDNMFSFKKKVESKFLCFSRKNDHEPCYVTNRNFTAWNSNCCDFDPTVKTVFIIPGFKDSYAPWTRILKDALILREVCNVFIVEYGQPLETYSEALESIPKVGKQVAVFIRKLMKLKGLDLQHVHIIGHSIGAHSAGFAGKETKKKKRFVGRITGLDPAGPGFYDATPDQRLDVTDASFVDVIHSNKGCSRLEGFGSPDAVGHFDFYPNGGALQPGCLKVSEFLGEMDFGLFKSAFKYVFGTLEQSEKKNLTDLLCSHDRSYVLFTASVLNESCKFRSVQCSSWKRYVSNQCDGNEKIAMGYYADRYRYLARDGRKKFYLSTTAHPPYC
ncbi:unnamed protein product [Larinioides sclopetarius]|uniref:Lipase domain-containing protein n=1 Tax=Larinioides sclopetarius TaxID=280406 RepID=A0AAV2B7X1_9ARAC